jgi:hypothetical protein
LAEAVHNALTATISSQHLELFVNVLELYADFYECRLLQANKSKLELLENSLNK